MENSMEDPQKVKSKVKVKSLSRVWLFETLWTVAHQAPPSMGFSRQEYWSGLPFPSPTEINSFPQNWLRNLLDSKFPQTSLTFSQKSPTFNQNSLRNLIIYLRNLLCLRIYSKIFSFPQNSLSNLFFYLKNLLLYLTIPSWICLFSP